MKNLVIIFFGASLFFSCKTETKEATKTDSGTVVITDTKSDEWVPVDSATSMKSMMEAGATGKEHALLAKSNGTWKAETTMWMAPDAPPMVSNGTVSNSMILGGRFQHMSFKGDMLGQPFEGVSTTGYDNARKVFTNTWVDNMTTSIMALDGTWDEASKTFTYTGKMLCPANGKMCDIKQTVKLVDDKTELMEMWGPDMKTGKPYKNMEIKLTRK